MSIILPQVLLQDLRLEPLVEQLVLTVLPVGCLVGPVQSLAPAAEETVHRQHRSVQPSRIYS